MKINIEMENEKYNFVIIGRGEGQNNKICCWGVRGLLFYHQIDNMNKTKSKIILQDPIQSPSPDKNPFHKIVPTDSPVHEVNYYRKICKNPKKSVDQSQYIHSMEKKIAALHQQLSKYQNYDKQLQALMKRNKRLEEQMYMLLQQIQAKNTEVSAPFQPNALTNRSEQSENIEILKSNIKQLQDIIEQLLRKYDKLQYDIKTMTKKDISLVQQRLMKYIFGLEEKLSQLGRKQILKQFKNEEMQSPVRIDVSGQVKESLISMKNLQVDEQFDTKKKQYHYACERCREYAEQIEELKSKLKMNNSPKSFKSRDTNQILQKIQCLQSNINVAIDSSNEDALNQQRQFTYPQFKLQPFLKEIKFKLSSISEDLGLLASQREEDEEYTNLGKKITLQEMKLIQSQSQIKKLGWQVQQKQRKIEKLEKLLKMELERHEEEQISSGRVFHPISCVNHEQTKRKLHQILDTMRNLETECQNKFTQ